MLNSVSLMGRMAAEPVVQTILKGEKEITIARYRLAVERDYKEGEHRPVDFIVCKAFGTNALYAGKYFHKGDTVIVSGRIFSEPYKKEGQEQGGFYTGVQVQKNYLAKKAGESDPNRIMAPQQDGIRNQQEENSSSQSLSEEEYPEFPPLPEEEYFQEYGDIPLM